jgi:hypothetical protein
MKVTMKEVLIMLATIAFMLGTLIAIFFLFVILSFASAMLCALTFKLTGSLSVTVIIMIMVGVVIAWLIKKSRGELGANMESEDDNV